MKDSLGKNLNGQEVFMKDVWPSNHEVEKIIQEFYRAETFREKYDQVFEGGDLWENLMFQILKIIIGQKVLT